MTFDLPPDVLFVSIGTKPIRKQDSLTVTATPRASKLMSVDLHFGQALSVLLRLAVRVGAVRRTPSPETVVERCVIGTAVFWDTTDN
jgi:hypothetical protein